MTGSARVIAAIDFGTHGTGFAWAFTSERSRAPGERRINFFDDWIGQPANYVKNLSALLLDGSGEVVEWGYQAQKHFQVESRTDPRLKYFQRFKMGLLPAKDAQHGTESPSVPGKSPSELITMYLANFRRFAFDKIIAGSSVAEDEIVWCLTVPAIWKDRERQMMRDCAVAAGLPDDRLLIAVEPEVAALYCRFDTGHASLGSVGERFMVIDAGGGTVDITAYQTTDNGLSEIGYTSGGSLGSTYIDQHLIQTVLPDRLGKDFVSRANALEPGALIALLDDWERAKRSFDVDQKMPIILQMSHRLFRVLRDEDRIRLGSRQNGVDDAIVLSVAEVAKLFDHLVKPILELVDDQLRKIGQRSVDRVMLVGGFAQSHYLQARLRAHLSRRVTMVVPAKPSWAVLLGAVHYGLEPGLITGRRSRFSYGIKFAPPFEEERDPPEFKTVNHSGAHLCNNRFDQFVALDEVVEPGHKVIREYIPILQTQVEMILQLYISTELDPRYVTQNSCEFVGQLTLDMSDTATLPPDERKVEVIMLFGGTEINVRARDVKSGKDVRTNIHFSQKA